jgi:hypothetical protein
LVKIQGQEGTRIRNYAELGELKILCRTPATAEPDEMPPEVLAELEADGRAHLPYYLDIWDENQKVFAVTWDEDERFRIVAFKRGDWERKLVGNSPPSASPAPH